LHCPKLDSGLSTLLSELDERGLLKETLVIAVGEFGRSPRLGVSTSGNSNSPDGRDHWPYCYTALMAGAEFAAALSMASPTRPGRRQQKTPCTQRKCWPRFTTL